MEQCMCQCVWIYFLAALFVYFETPMYHVCVADGVRDKDKTLLMATLANIATVRDNTYHLMRHVWNDVQEDWPFYTEQDRQMLKRWLLVLLIISKPTKDKIIWSIHSHCFSTQLFVKEGWGGTLKFLQNLLKKLCFSLVKSQDYHYNCTVNIH